MKHTQTFKDFESVNENTDKVNEGHSLSLRDEYAKLIWDKYQNEILKLVDKINAEEYDHGSSEIICDGLSEIFAKLGDNPGSAYNAMNK